MIRRYSQWVTVVVALFLLVAGGFYTRYQMQAQASKMVPVKIETQPDPDVTVVSAQSGSYAAKITAYGEATPHFELSLTAQVSGQVVSLDDNFEPGKRVKKGTVLVQLEDSEYQAALASAKKDLADARLTLLEEERQAQQASSEWSASGLDGDPDSDLVLRKPQLTAARAAVTNAEAALASARKDLAQTRITVPFDALVVERQVAPGSFLQAGGDVATLYSTDRLEIAVALSARDWRSLPEMTTLNEGLWPAELTGVEDGEQWDGRVLRTEQHLDSTTRQRALIVAVDQPLNRPEALLPGTFLKVQVEGRSVDQLWKLPSSALSQRGEIWYVTQDNTLASFMAEPLFSSEDYIYIKPPSNLATQTQKVLVHPLSSYLKAMAVNPVEESSHE